MKWTLTATLAAALLLAASAQGRSGATVTIRHQVQGCHTWSVDGGLYRARQAVRIRRGASITFLNYDVMPHRLVKTSGPKIAGRGLNMNRMMSAATVKFTHAGVYTFTTKPGEDYPMMMVPPTTGEDNVLKLTVRVT